MGISGSLVLIAVGAILKWAVTATVSGVSLDTVGVIPSMSSCAADAAPGCPRDVHATKAALLS